MLYCTLTFYVELYKNSEAAIITARGTRTQISYVHTRGVVFRCPDLMCVNVYEIRLLRSFFRGVCSLALHIYDEHIH